VSGIVGVVERSGLSDVDQRSSTRCRPVQAVVKAQVAERPGHRTFLLEVFLLEDLT
jgi:hypothetical protein